MGVAERREREKRQREEQIRDAAIKVFQEKGFNGATIEEIAREAELGVGTIYLYFKTKEELYASLNLAKIKLVEEALNEIIGDQGASPEKKLELAWKSLSTIYCQSPIYIRALVHGQLQGSLQNISPDLLSSLNRTAGSIMGKLAAIFKEGIEEGRFLKVNVAALADLFWGSFTGVVGWEEAKRTTDPRKAFLEPTLGLAFKVFLKGISERGRSEGQD